MLIRKLLIALGAALSGAFVAGTPALAQTSPAAVPVEAFFQNPAFSGGTLSPNGRYLALKVAAKDQRTKLVVMDVEKLTAKAIVTPTDSDINLVQWVNDDRLVFDVHDTQTATGDTVVGSGLYAVSRDGSDYRQLVNRQHDVVREITMTRRMIDAKTWYLAGTVDRKGEDIFIGQPEWNHRYELTAINILRLNTVTGRTTPFMRPGQTHRWVVDATDVPRVAMTYEKGQVGVHLMQADGKWAEIVSFPDFSNKTFVPLALSRDGKSLFVSANNGRDKDALYRYDLEKRELDAEPLLSLKDFDFTGGLVMGAEGPVGVRYTSDAQATAWFDPRWKAAQARIDTLLPNTVNRMEVPLRPELPIVMVRAYSDVDPGTYYLFNTQTAKLTALGPAMRGVDPKLMAPRDLVRYKARDGLEIPAWLTVPKGGKGKKLPMVVLVHGGPWLRGGDWAWRSDSEFLASRGYLVLEPEFRGSTGFGHRHFRAGFRQWGLAMQDDIADGAKWAIAQGIADPSRICIAGASYGGYATMMGLVNDPALFKCGVNWAGVADIDLMYSPQWSYLTQSTKNYTLRQLIGDPEQLAEQFRKTSPIEQGSRIKQPVLLAYGGADTLVPIVHGTRLKSAVQKDNPNVEWIEYTEEGHGWSLVQNRVDFWTRVEKFLGKHLGGP